MAKVRFDIYLLLPTLGRGSITRITTFTTFLQRSSSSLTSIQVFFLDSRTPGPVSHLSYYYPLLVRYPRHPEAVDNSTPFLTRSFGRSRTFSFAVCGCFWYSIGTSACDLYGTSTPRRRQLPKENSINSLRPKDPFLSFFSLILFC